jgi:hypothetical protein
LLLSWQTLKELMSVRSVADQFGGYGLLVSFKGLSV